MRSVASRFAPSVSRFSVLTVFFETIVGECRDRLADALAIGARTVETYCSRMIEKLGLDGMKALRRYAIQRH